MYLFQCEEEERKKRPTWAFDQYEGCKTLLPLLIVG
jgi:hypothetical protein